MSKSSFGLLWFMYLSWNGILHKWVRWKSNFTKKETIVTEFLEVATSNGVKHILGGVEIRLAWEASLKFRLAWNGLIMFWQGLVIRDGKFFNGSFHFYYQTFIRIVCCFQLWYIFQDIVTDSTLYLRGEKVDWKFHECLLDDDVSVRNAV